VKISSVNKTAFAENPEKFVKEFKAKKAAGGE